MITVFGPEIGPVYDGNKQNIKIMNRKGITKTYVSNKETIDEYISANDKVRKNVNKVWALSAGIGGVVGAVAGALISRDSRGFGAAIGAFNGAILTFTPFLIGASIKATKTLEKLAKETFEAK